MRVNWLYSVLLGLMTVFTGVGVTAFLTGQDRMESRIDAFGTVLGNVKEQVAGMNATLSSIANRDVMSRAEVLGVVTALSDRMVTAIQGLGDKLGAIVEAIRRDIEDLRRRVTALEGK